MLRVSVLQLPASWNERDRVLASVERALGEGPRSDIVLLPEASLTGYVSAHGDFDLTPFAEAEDGATARALAALAARHRTAIVGPLVLAADGKVYNATVAFDARGDHLFTYRKRHPWIPETWAAPGAERPPVVTVAGARVTVCVCYDVHFAPDDAAEELQAADLLLFPSAWVDEDDTRVPLLGSLARRFGVCVANANWSAGVVRVPGQGGSCVLAADGAAIASAAPDARGVTRVDAVVSPR